MVSCSFLLSTFITMYYLYFWVSDMSTWYLCPCCPLHLPATLPVSSRLLEFSNFLQVIVMWAMILFNCCCFVFEVEFHRVSMVNLNWLSITGWPWAHRVLLAFPFQILGLKVCSSVSTDFSFIASKFIGIFCNLKDILPVHSFVTLCNDHLNTGSLS